MNNIGMSGIKNPGGVKCHILPLLNLFINLFQYRVIYYLLITVYYYLLS